MKIQRFEARDVQEALRMAQAALGPNAVVLQTRRVQSTGFKGIVSRPRVEILAAVDTPAPSSATERSPDHAARGAPERRSPTDGVPNGARVDVGTPTPGSTPGSALGDRERSDLEPYSPSAFTFRGSHGRDGATDRPVGTRLGRPLEEMARRALAEIETKTIEIREGTATTVALVGPTGVGKTTTIAKLAAVATHVERQRVAFITVDTYRIGAVEQLETYARLQEIPLTVAYSPEEVRAARDRYADYDLVLVDTIGRSPRNLKQLEELALLLDAAQPDEVHLVLDTRASLRTQDSVLRGFGVLRPTHLLLSKLDEAAQLEDTLATALEGGLPLSYVTTGQRVPEDLAPADRTHLAGYLFSQ
jgi:flagellar biosynthesis protein FlhF